MGDGIDYMRHAQINTKRPPHIGVNNMRPQKPANTLSCLYAGRSAYDKMVPSQIDARAWVAQ